MAGRPCPSPGAARRATNPRSQTLGFLSLHRCIFRKCRSLRHFEKRGIPAQTNPNEGRGRKWGGVIPLSSKLGAQEASRKGTTLVFLHPQLSGPRGAPLSFRNRPLQGNHTRPGEASPSHGQVVKAGMGFKQKQAFSSLASWP